MAQAGKQRVEHSTKSGSQVKNAFQASVYRFGDVTAHAPYLGEIEKELVHVSTSLQKEAKTVTSEALDVIKHPISMSGKCISTIRMNQLKPVSKISAHLIELKV